MKHNLKLGRCHIKYRMGYRAAVRVVGTTTGMSKGRLG
jgi:hypothetical protein